MNDFKRDIISVSCQSKCIVRLKDMFLKGYPLEGKNAPKSWN